MKAANRRNAAPAATFKAASRRLVLIMAKTEGGLAAHEKTIQKKGA